MGLWEAEDIGVVSMEEHKAGGRGCKFSDKAFQPSEQVEERDYFTCLPLWLRYRLQLFQEVSNMGVISHPRHSLVYNVFNGYKIHKKS